MNTATPPVISGNGGSSPPPIKPATGISRFKIERGSKNKGQKILIYGTGGIGKSTFASLFPKPLFIDLEDSAKFLTTVERLDMQDASFGEIVGFLKSEKQFITSKYKTIIIDSSTKLEEIISADICAASSVSSIEDLDYKVGYTKLVEQYIGSLNLLNEFVRDGINVVLVAHDAIIRQVNAEGSNYTVVEPRLYHNNNKPSQSIMLRTCEDSDHVLYLKKIISVDGKGKVANAQDVRAIYTKSPGTFKAKSRLPLKESYDWNPDQKDAKALIQQIISGGTSND